MKINRQTVHSLLVDFKDDNISKSFGFFSNAKSALRTCLENIRGDLELHKKDNYKRMGLNLNLEEMAELEKAL